jgi:methionyl-tRNA formyltransferase
MVNFAFFGTPEFAVPALDGLQQFCLKNQHTLAMVICQPNKPSLRGKKIHAPPVKEFATKYLLPVYQPASLKKDSQSGEEFYDVFQKAHIDMAIVVAYGRIIPTRLLSVPTFGFINIHASLLPRFRGASPIQHALLAGDKETGVSIMALVPELDAGDIYRMVSVPIQASDDALTLSKKIAKVGKETLLECLPLLLANKLPKIPQASKGITYASLLRKKSGEINWYLSAREIVNHSRAMQPWPGSYTFHKGAMLRLFNAEVLNAAASKFHQIPGTVTEASTHLSVQTPDGIVAFHEAQLDGKKRLHVKELLNGYSIKAGDVFDKPCPISL